MKNTTLEGDAALLVKEHFRESIAVALSDLRESRGLTLEDLSDRCSMPVPGISRALSGSHNFTVDTLAVLLHGLGGKVTIK